MSCSNSARFRRQVCCLQSQFLKTDDLPFTGVLPAVIVSQALANAGVVWKDRAYTQMVSLWIVLGQAMSDDHSCRTAVAWFVAHRVPKG